MSDELNFSTQFYPHMNKLKNWVNIKFYPYIKKMIQRSDTFRIYHLSSHKDSISISKGNTKYLTSLEKIVEELNHFKKKAGLYGVNIETQNESAFIYSGKSKDLSSRVRQHWTGKNLNGEPISESTKHKYSEICHLVTQNIFNVSFFIWTSKRLEESSSVDYELGILEALFIAKSKDDFLALNQRHNLSLKHWNLRIG